MKKKILVSGLLIAASAVAVAAGDFVIVVNKDSPLSSISKIQLKRLYTGKIKDLNGVQLVPIDLPVESPAAVAFLHDILGMESGAYKEFWMEQQVKGLGTAPMIQKTTVMVKAIISQVPGGIGYITKSDADDSVKKIKVE
jgi:ABC-type phosphate transport system substrate-binding protein